MLRLLHWQLQNCCKSANEAFVRSDKASSPKLADHRRESPVINVPRSKLISRVRLAAPHQTLRQPRLPSVIRTTDAIASVRCGMNQFRIAAAQPGDIPAVLAMIRGLAEFEHLAHLCTATEDQLSEALFGSNSTVEVVVAWEDDENAGFALFFHNFSTFLGRRGLYLEDLFIRPQFRGRGYGRALLVHLARLAVERGCGRFEWAVLDWNEKAIGFYRGLGATVLPDWRITRVAGDALSTLAAMPQPQGERRS